jgi:dTDP-4-dehydrorhamnose reductase
MLLAYIIYKRIGKRTKKLLKELKNGKISRYDFTKAIAASKEIVKTYNTNIR